MHRQPVLGFVTAADRVGKTLLQPADDRVDGGVPRGPVRPRRERAHRGPRDRRLGGAATEQRGHEHRRTFVAAQHVETRPFHLEPVRAPLRHCLHERERAVVAATAARASRTASPAVARSARPRRTRPRARDTRRTRRRHARGQDQEPCARPATHARRAARRTARRRDAAALVRVCTPSTSRSAADAPLPGVHRHLQPTARRVADDGGQRFHRTSRPTSSRKRASEGANRAISASRVAGASSLRGAAFHGSGFASR